MSKMPSNGKQESADSKKVGTGQGDNEQLE
jgi:hypothetical protein